MSKVTETAEGLRVLGQRLRDARLARNDSMAVFSQRLGVSERTLRAMERGEPTVQVGTWVDALWILDRLDELHALLAPRDSLIDRARNSRRPPRQRASRRPG
jgi:transcriptional regulator with XRE-family HTH domain